MYVMSGNFVDMNGKVQIPYLSEWNFPHSDLLSLLQIMTTVFSDELPVRGRFTDLLSSGCNVSEKSSSSCSGYSGEVGGRSEHLDGVNTPQNELNDSFEYSGEVHGRKNFTWYICNIYL
ncbi:ubiquitin-conjugating enzyme E2 variant 3-like, partial [Ruditapes philippinarum]|uniref:ubiquitin-conjugating enzyme E2 variant 3-like n=1 Tax=Ruditapes philippinarum TaxID=129788 RepID=UPI00295BFDFA